MPVKVYVAYQIDDEGVILDIIGVFSTHEKAYEEVSSLGLFQISIEVFELDKLEE